SESARPSIRSLRYSNFGIEDEHLRAMLQALLIERFQLKFHRETRTGDVYLLQRSGKELRLRPSHAVAAGDPPVEVSGWSSIGFAGGRWVIDNTTMAQLAKY